MATPRFDKRMSAVARTGYSTVDLGVTAVARNLLAVSAQQDGPPRVARGHCVRQLPLLHTAAADPIRAMGCAGSLPESGPPALVAAPPKATRVRRRLPKNTMPAQPSAKPQDEQYIARFYDLCGAASQRPPHKPKVDQDAVEASLDDWRCS